LALIAQNLWKDAMESTVLYFFYDMLFTIKYSTLEDFFTLKTTSIMLHHFLGFSLCFYSALIESYNETHLGAKVTRALLMLEVCNPLLHFSTIIQNECPEMNSFCLSGIKCAMLANYFYVRVWTLANALRVDNEDKERLAFYSVFPTSLFFLFAILLWVLQFLWFIYMAGSMVSKVMKCFTPESYKEN
jgi:hypothetical protein